MIQAFEKIRDTILSISPRTQIIASLALLIAISLLMIASASVPFASSRDIAPLRYFWAQLSYVSAGVVFASITYLIPLNKYYNRHFNLVLLMWIVVLVLLGLTTAVGEVVNGSRRWLSLGIFNLQAAEIAKAAMVFVAADYVVRRSAEVRGSIISGWRLLVWYAPICVLLMLQPDYGTVMVLLATLAIIILISGAPATAYAALVTLLIILAGVGAIIEPYRRERMLSFMDPFDDIQGSDYQLARSLIAFGRGEFWGDGYGNSVQKLSHLPEAHTDFLLAITGEELGFVGVATVLTLQMLIIIGIMRISLTSLKRRQLRLSYTTFGFGTVIFGQVLINGGMNMGLLPTKGLTMPFFSFGGSSVVVLLIMIGYILRVHKESPIINAQRQNTNY